MDHSTWIVRLFILATVWGTTFAFVSLPSPCSNGVGVSTRAPSLLSLKAINTTTAQATSVSVLAPDQDTLAALLSQSDPKVDAPLPPAYTACPFNGVLGGPKSFLRVASQALKAPKLFSFVHKNKPVVEICGGAEVQELLNQEFTNLQSNAMAGHSQAACGTHSLRTAQSRREHRVLRDLVGVPLSGPAVAASIPRLQAICQDCVNDWILRKPAGSVLRTVDMTGYMALEVVWQQVLGLDFQTPEEIETFHQQATRWLEGTHFVTRPDSPQFQSMLQAKEYLVQAMKKKIEQLRQAGQSDGSTMGGLVYATWENEDEGDYVESSSERRRTLTTEQIIDNALLLILAGTETTSTNLANVIMLMGFHPDVWEKVVEEQRAVVREHGETLTKDILDHHVPYMDAVIQETLRILPVTLLSRRVTGETIVIDGQQIPQGWAVGYNIFLTHQRDEAVASSNGHDPMDLMTGFQPSRWLDPDTRPSKKDYIPFGTGPRKCPGILLAKTEMKMFLSIFARNVSYELVNEVDTSKPVDSQIVWKQLNSVPLAEDGVQIRIL